MLCCAHLHEELVLPLVGGGERRLRLQDHCAGAREQRGFVRARVCQSHRQQQKSGDRSTGVSAVAAARDWAGLTLHLVRGVGPEPCGVRPHVVASRCGRLDLEAHICKRQHLRRHSVSPELLSCRRRRRRSLQVAGGWASTLRSAISPSSAGNGPAWRTPLSLEARRTPLSLSLSHIAIAVRRAQLPRALPRLLTNQAPPVLPTPVRARGNPAIPQRPRAATLLACRA